MHDCLVSVLRRSAGRLEPEIILKFQVVHSPVRSKTGTCERGLSYHDCNYTSLPSTAYADADNNIIANVALRELLQGLALTH